MSAIKEGKGSGEKKACRRRYTEDKLLFTDKVECTNGYEKVPPPFMLWLIIFKGER